MASGWLHAAAGSPSETPLRLPLPLPLPPRSPPPNLPALLPTSSVLQYYIVRVDAPPGVATISAEGCFVTVESGPHSNLTLALQALQNPKQRVRPPARPPAWPACLAGWLAGCACSPLLTLKAVLPLAQAAPA